MSEGFSSHRTKRWLILGGLCVAATTLYLIYQSHDLAGNPPWKTMPFDGQVCAGSAPPPKEPWLTTENSLNFPNPTTLAQDNLRNDTHYITGFALAGFTNEFIAIVNMIYLGFQSQRVPIIPPFVPGAHVSRNAQLLPFSQVFNLTNLRNAQRRALIEWTDVKSIPSNATATENLKPDDPTTEHFGCWSVRQRNFAHPIWVTPTENMLKIDMSYTRVPAFTFINPADEKDIHTSIPLLAALIAPKHPHPESLNLPLFAPSRFKSTLAPGTHLACFDFLYYVAGSGAQRHEIERRWSPVWNQVASHLTFTDDLMDLTRSYLRRAMKIDSDAPIPPMITVHIRRGDFRSKCKSGHKPPCYVPLPAYRQSAEKMQADLLETRNISVAHVFVASDETDTTFWEEINSYGWYRIDHIAEKTEERLGHWHSMLLDKVALSMGIGFVGTGTSTFTVLNGWRVEDWNNGVIDVLDYYKYQ